LNVKAGSRVIVDLPFARSFVLNHRGDPTLLGAKHPALCCLGEELAAAWPRRRFIVVDRDFDEIVASISRTDWGWNRDEATLAVAAHDQREQFLARCDPAEIFRLDFHQLLANPQQEILRLTAHLSLPLAPGSLEASVHHVTR
jgi:hypothetical protein